MRLVLGGRQRRSPYTSTRTLNVHIEALMGLSHVHSPVGFNNTLLSQGRVLKNGSGYGNGGQNVCSKCRARGEEPWLPGSRSLVSCGHVLLMSKLSPHHVRTHLQQARATVPTINPPCQTLILDFQPLKLRKWISVF